MSKRSLQDDGWTGLSKKITKIPREEDKDNDEAVSVDETVEDFDNLDEKTELEIRDFLLEESAVGLSENQEKEKSFKIIKLQGELPKLSLPAGWIALCHRSGGIIYLHRQTRVCTWARPYHIGDASVRKHDVPIAAIPCFHQFNALRKIAVKKPETAEQVPQMETGYSDEKSITSQGSNFDNQSSDFDNQISNLDNLNNNLDNQNSNLDNQNSNLDNQNSNLDNQNSNLDNQNSNLDNQNSNLDNQNSTSNLDNQNSNLDNQNSNLDTRNCKSVDFNGKVKQLELHVGTQHNIHGSQSSEISNSNRSSPSCDLSYIRETVLDRNNTKKIAEADEVNENIFEDCSSDSQHKAETEDGEIEPDLRISDDATSQNPGVLLKISSGEIEMVTLSEIADYLGKLWQFQEITPDQEKLALLSFNPNKVDRSLDTQTTIPYLFQGVNPRAKVQKQHVFNPVGKSPQSLLHEYCTKVLKLKPVYKARESGDPKKPFLATVEVDGLQYGSGMATSKKQARHLAAQATLDVFIPGTYEKLVNVEQYLKVFDNVPIEDASVFDLTTKLGLMTPFQVLKECLSRNQGVLTSELKFEMQFTDDKNICYSIQCGKYSASGPCRNKKYGRQLASQALLQKLHPHLKSWGSVLRIYIDKYTIQKFTKPEDISVPVASSVKTNINRELLSDLKHEMWKLLKKQKGNSSTSASTKFTDIQI